MLVEGVQFLADLLEVEARGLRSAVMDCLVNTFKTQLTREECAGVLKTLRGNAMHLVKRLQEDHESLFRKVTRRIYE